MAVDNRARELVSLGLLANLAIADPGMPDITSSAGEDGQVVLTIAADAETDDIFARYRSANTTWSAESGTFSRTGSGDITITGLTNGTQYEFAIYSKDDSRESLWDFSTATPTDDDVTDTALDEELVPETLSIINEFGYTAKFKPVTTQIFNPATGTVTEEGASEYLLKVSPPEGYEEKFVDNTLIKQGDNKILLPASGLEFVPKAKVKVEIKDVIWTVVKVSPIFSGEQIAVYELQIRK